MPDCDCHGEPMYWDADKKGARGGYWRCVIKRREYDRSRHERRKPQRAVYLREWYPRKKYGLSADEYETLLAGGCAICGQVGGKMCCDHDHDSGAIRGALCDECNKGLGCFKDDPERLQAAISYLAAHASSVDPPELYVEDGL